MNVNSLAHTKWNCKYYIVFVPKYKKSYLYSRVVCMEEKQSIICSQFITKRSHSQCTRGSIKYQPDCGFDA